MKKKRFEDDLDEADKKRVEIELGKREFNSWSEQIIGEYQKNEQQVAGLLKEFNKLKDKP